LLLSFHQRKGDFLNKILTYAIEKEWKHKKILYSMGYLMKHMSLKMNFRRTTSMKSIKTVFINVNGKINSGNRTKNFQIKNPYKPSRITLETFMSNKKGFSNAKTGSFGINTLFSY
jgi:hypothetical protein